jgi:hypothetical protein
MISFRDAIKAFAALHKDRRPPVAFWQLKR